jgi:hypothetical protein
VLAIDVAEWARETTINNLELHKEAFAADSSAISRLDETITALKRRAVGGG